jgi:predicted ATPase
MKRDRMREKAEQFFVITGGPGSGKSSLLDALQARGFARSAEAGRGVIQDQVEIGAHALPWSNPAAFAELMLCWEMRSYRMAQERSGIVFFDRGVPDVVGYLRLMKLLVPAYMETAARILRYNRLVFVAPPWEEIFTQDRERKQDFSEAVATYESMVATYENYGYQSVEIPRAPVEDRVEFVLRNITIQNHS